MCEKYRAHLKYRLFYIPGNKILKSTSYFSLAGPRIDYSVHMALEQSYLQNGANFLTCLTHTHTQRLIYFGGRKRGLSYAAIGSKEIHFTHARTHAYKPRKTDTHTQSEYVIPKTRSFFSVPKNNVARSRQSNLPDGLPTA
jgi:hypothetical protein